MDRRGRGALARRGPARGPRRAPDPVGHRLTAAGFAEGPTASPGYLLWCVTLSWQRAVTAALRPLGVTHVQFVVLVSAWWLHGQGSAPSQVELARHAALDVKMTSQVVRTLEGKGLLARDPDPADARARRLRATEAGVMLARRAVVVVEEVDRRFFGDESGAAVPLLRRLLPADES